MLTLSDAAAVLHCCLCANLPTKPPIFQRDDGELVCAECASFIPNNWVRLKHLELLLPLLNVPNQSDTEPRNSPRLSEPAWNKSISRLRSEDFKVELGCTLKRNRTTKNPTVLQYNLSICKQGGKQLYLADSALSGLQGLTPVDISIKGAIALTGQPEQVYGSMDLIPLQHTGPKCNMPCLESEFFCVEKKAEEVHIICRNGCLWRGPRYDLGDHLNVCPMVKLRCVLPHCTWKDAAQLMIGHFYNEHEKHMCEEVRGRFTSLDRFCVTQKCGILFLFKYFYYERDFVEFLVQGVANCNQLDYKFTVHVECTPELNVKGHKASSSALQRSAKCLVYNKCVLQKGVVFSAHEYRKLMNSQYTVSITACND